jgi:uncharacterized membrane protein YgdD (TMEM256/DUF423 family)
MVAALYFLAGLVIGVSARHFALQGGAHLLALLLSALLCNAIILGFQRFSLPRIERQLQQAIAARSGPAFARQIIRREMAKILQPVGGIAFTIGFLTEIIVVLVWR